MISKCNICGLEFIKTKEYELHMKAAHMSINDQLKRNIDVSLSSQAEEQRVSDIQIINNINKLGIDLNRHIFIAGQTQRGKSFFVKELINSIPKTQKLIFVDYKHDPNHLEFIAQFKAFQTLRGIKNYFRTDKKGFLEREQKDMRVVYRPKRIVSDNIDTYSMKNPKWKMINDLCEYVYTHGNVMLVVDEAAPFSTGQKIPPSYYDLMIMGAARGVTTVNLTQRPIGVHNSIISESYSRIFFRLDLKGDRDKIRGFTSDEIAEEVGKLPSRVFIIHLQNGKNYKGTLKIK